MTMTLVSILAALIVGGLETLNLIGGKLQLEGDFWKAVGSVSENFGILGYIIIGVFAATWALSAALYHLMGYGRLDARPATAPSE
jgi:high-affinity nickel-transport protein